MSGFAQKTTFANPPLQRRGSISKTKDFARNCMKCPDPHRKVMFSKPPPPMGSGGMWSVILQKKNFLLGIA